MNVWEEANTGQVHGIVPIQPRQCAAIPALVSSAADVGKLCRAGTAAQDRRHRCIGSAAQVHSRVHEQAEVR